MASFRFVETPSPTPIAPAWTEQLAITPQMYLNAAFLCFMVWWLIGRCYYACTRKRKYRRRDSSDDEAENDDRFYEKHKKK